MVHLTTILIFAPMQHAESSTVCRAYGFDSTAIVGGLRFCYVIIIDELQQQRHKEVLHPSSI
ncbi:hypothetical protein CsSME_00035072 [Camellia sinensis var. sinensis]